MNIDSETTLRLERLIPVPPESLFALWVEPAQLVKWWAIDGYEASVHRLDSRSGGPWRVIMRSAGGAQLATSGVYRIVEPPHRLSFTWAWEGADGTRGHETEVTVSFEPVPGGTRLVLLQQRFESREACQNHNRGWSGAFDRLATVGQAVS
jgi:uncharacterized protein YndB with AHSA1/START domain